MSDWQINHLLGEPVDEQLSYNEVLAHVWKLRGYTEDEVEQIIDWKAEGITDDVLLDRVKESLGAR